MGSFSITPFYGLFDNTEDPEEYLEEIEYAALSENATTDLVRRIFFRRNLRGNAKLWYRYLDPQTKADWGTLQAQFRGRYEVQPNTKRIQLLLIEDKISALLQEPNESVVEYMNRCATLEAQSVGLKHVQGFGQFMINGLSDNWRREHIQAQLRKAGQTSCNFRTAKDNILFIYRSADNPELLADWPGRACDLT